MTRDLVAQKELLPYGQIATRDWLLESGMTRHQVDNAIKSGAFQTVARGVFMRPGVKLTWQGVAASLNKIGREKVWVGGITALEEHGYAHYLRVTRPIHVYAACPRPSWLQRIKFDVHFEWHNVSRLWSEGVAMSAKGLQSQVWFGSDPYLLALPEQAIMEALMDVPDKLGFEHADQLMEGLVTLSPRRLDWLLTSCTHIRVKRLFLYLGKRHGHGWYKRLDCSRYDLGTGNRVIANPGRLDPDFMITVPRSFGEEE